MDANTKSLWGKVLTALVSFLGALVGSIFGA